MVKVARSEDDKKSMLRSIREMNNPDCSKEVMIENGSYIYLTILRQKLEYKLKIEKSIADKFVETSMIALSIFFRRVYPKEYDERMEEMNEFIKTSKGNDEKIEKLKNFVVLLIGENAFLTCRRYKKGFWEKVLFSIKGKTPFLEAQLESLEKQ